MDGLVGGLVGGLVVTQTYKGSPFHRSGQELENLPPGWRQITIQDFPFRDGRIWTFDRRGWIAILDDDDRIDEKVFAKAAALAEQNPEAGAILCDWWNLDESSGELEDCNRGLIRYADLLESPLACHQLALVNCAEIPADFYELAKGLERCWEWLFTAGAIIEAGAIHLPEKGYYWTQWEGQDHRRKAKECAEAMQQVRKILQNLADCNGRNMALTIPQDATPKLNT